MKVLICGGRDFNDVEYLNAVLTQIHKKKFITTLIHGAAKGADTLAALWGHSQIINVIAIPAEWDQYGKSAGYIRNVQMADLKPDLVIAFSGGKGTAMMIDIAEKRGIKVLKCKRDKKPSEKPSDSEKHQTNLAFYKTNTDHGRF